VVQETKENKTPNGPLNPEAYKAYLMGHLHTYRMTQDFEKDIIYYKKTMELDPSFAEPYAGMAMSYFLQCVASKISPQEALAQARIVVQKALDLNPSLAEGHAARGVVKLGLEYDSTGGRKALQNALELKPNSADIQINWIWYLVITGQVEEAVAKNLNAIDLDPLNPVNNFFYGWTCLMARRYDKGIEFTKRLLDQDPLCPHARLRLSELYAAKGMHKEALEEIEHIEKSQIPYLAWVYAVSGQPGKARALLVELEVKRKTQYMDATFLARGYAGLGEKDKAFAWLETAFRERSPHLLTLKVFPGFDGLRSDPRYQDLLERISLADCNQPREISWKLTMTCWRVLFTTS
jgi:tetratricopeptide (TPR) repeat protein